MFKRNNIKEFGLVQSIAGGEWDFNQFMQLRIQLVVVAQNRGWSNLILQAGYNKVQRIKRTNQACSQSGSSFGLTKEKNLCNYTVILCGRARWLLGTFLKSCKEEGRKIVSMNCYYELWTGIFFRLRVTLKSVGKKAKTIQPICFVRWKKCCILSIPYLFSIRVTLIRNIGNNWNLFRKLKTKSKLYDVELTNPKFSREKIII